MFLYKYVLNNEIIYIGKTTRDVTIRINEHHTKRDLPDNCNIYISECDNEADMNVLELLLIDKYRPKFNKDGNSISYIKSNINFKEPDWIKYEDYLNNIEVVEYKRNNNDNIVGLTNNNKEIKPVYCSCNYFLQVPELNLTEEACYQTCKMCHSLIKGSFQDLNY